MKNEIKFIIFIIALMYCSFLNSQEPLEEILTIQNPFSDYQFSSFIKEGSGDVNGDGYSDFIISKNDNSDFTTVYEGEVRLYLGKPHLTETPDFIFTSNNNDNFGQTASIAGDINGDGYDDVIISAIYAAPAGAGEVYIYLGGDPFNMEVDYVLNGANYAQVLYINLSYGMFLSADNDFNNDGYDDLVIGGWGPTMSWEGQVDVFLGGDPFDTESDFCLYGQNYFDGYGRFIIGDINGDGYDDFLPKHTVDYEYILDIYAGGEDFPPTLPIATLNMDSIGYDNKAINSGNIDDDFNDELIYTFVNLTPFYKTMNIISFDLDFQIACTDSIPYNYYDYGVVSHIFFSDINNDNENDLIIASDSDSHHHYAGIVNIYYGGTLLDTIPDIVMTGSVNYEYFGKVGYNLGDVNGDGNTDILLGSSAEPIGSTIIDYVTIYTEENLVSIDNDLVHADFKLYNYPNPFNPSTKIRFQTSDFSDIENAEIIIYNIKGQKVKQLISDHISAGQHSIIWNGNDESGKPVSSGVYLYKLNVIGKTKVIRKCLLLK